MHHSPYAIRLLAEQRRAELIAEAARLNQFHDARRRRARRRSFRSLLARFRRPVPGRTEVIDLREPSTPEPVPQAAMTEDTSATRI